MRDKANTLIIGFDEPLARWACDRIPWADYGPTMRAVGVSAGPEASDKLLAVCVYHNYIPPKQIDGKTWFGICEISFAAESASWASRRTISNLLRIPFLDYKCRKVVTVIPSTNKRAIRFNEGIGMKLEGTLSDHFAKGVHACVFGMKRGYFDVHWKDLKRRPSKPQVHGQIHPVSAAAN